MSGCAASDAPHIEQLQLQLLQQGQGRHHALSGATGLTFLEQRFACLFDRAGAGYRMQVMRRDTLFHLFLPPYFILPLTSVLQGGWCVCDLDLSHNSLGAAGGLAIFEALKANALQPLRTLKLVSCKLSSLQLGVCMGKVLGAGEAMCMLRELDIGWNDFDDAAMQVQAVTDCDCVAIVSSRYS
jgi:hypothetical protein